MTLVVIKRWAVQPVAGHIYGDDWAIDHLFETKGGAKLYAAEYNRDAGKKEMVVVPATVTIGGA